MEEISQDKLYTFLKEKLKDRIGDKLNLKCNGSIFSTLDGKRFTITYSKSHMLLSTTNQSKEVIEELEPILNEYMHVKPICSYDMLYNGDDVEYYVPSIEWDTVNPNARLKLIINNNAFSNAKVFNIELFNSRNIYDYVENKEKTLEKY